MTPGSQHDAPGVLFIDDDATGREVAEFRLRGAGYRVDLAADGAEGLERFDATFPVCCTYRRRSNRR